MNFQYFIIIILLTLTLFLFALWINRTTKIFIWNYFAAFSAVIAYLFVDTFVSFIDQNSKILWITNPDAICWFLMNYKTIIIILIYFFLFVLFYKSNLFEIKIEWILKKAVWYFALPLITVVNLVFSMMLVINWPNLLTYNWYKSFVESLNITDLHILSVTNILPWVIIFVPALILVLFININIKFKIPNIGRRIKKEKENDENIVEEKSE